MEQLVLHVFLLLTSNSKKGNPAPDVIGNIDATYFSNGVS